MKAKRFLLLMVSLCLVFVFVSVSFVDDCTEKALAQSKTYEWKMTSTFPARHTLNRNLAEFAKKLGEDTNGAVKITFYESTLGAPTDQWDMVKSNAIQIAYLGEAYSPGRMPIISLFNMPFEIPNMSACQELSNNWLKAGYLKELTDNFKVLYFIPTFLQSPFMRNKKVTSLGDLKGLKLRSVSGIQGQAITALGATGVSMPGGEVYMGLQTGVIDGTITGIDNFIDRKFYEPCKYAMQFPIYGGAFVVAMNKETWNGLPKDLQTLIEKLAQDISNSALKTLVGEEDGFWETARKNKVEVYNISPEEQVRWKNGTAGVADKYVQEWAVKGYPVKEALDMMRKVASRK